MIDDNTVQRFMRLFSGRTDAYGTGQGRWIKQRPTLSVYKQHLLGQGPGLGIAPLLDDGTVRFAAIDLDEPDFAAGTEMQEYLPGPSFMERSRSGNCHVWVFFDAPIEAWVVRGILKEAILAAGKGAVEIFPKQDKLRDDQSVGNYINLAYHGDDRPVVEIGHLIVGGGTILDEWPLGRFLHEAELNLNDPEAWRKRAAWLMISPPDQRISEHREFGTQSDLHCCAEYVIANRESNPVLEGHRAVVFFNLAKMLSNYEGFDHEEALYLMKLVNDASPDRVDDSELGRILRNAERGRFTSTGCDDPLFQPYADPDCPILKGAK